MKKYSVDVRIQDTGSFYRQYRFQADTTHECVQFIERLAEQHELMDWDYLKQADGIVIYMTDEKNGSPLLGTADIHRTCIAVLD
jgi:hypothetical protein